MAILQRVSFFPNERLDTPDIRSIEAFGLNDWRYFLLGTMSDKSYVLTGFDITNYTTLFTVAGFSLQTSNVVMYHPESTTQAGGFYVYAGTEPNVAVTLSPNATNFVEVDFTTESAVPDVRAFWDSAANPPDGAEFTDTVDTVINLKLSITSNISGFTSGKVPLYKVVTDVNGVATSVTDCRNLFFRLGTGGTTPDANHDFSWPSLPDATHAQFETPSTSTGYTSTNAPWQGGDKNLKNFKDWMDAIMTSLKEIKGVPYWYMSGGGGGGIGITGAYQNSALTILQNGTWQHNPSTLGSLVLLSGSKIVRLGFANDPVLSAFAGVDLTTFPAFYVILPKSDVAVTYGFGDDAATPVTPKSISAFSSSSISVATGGNYASGGGKIMVRSEEFTYTSYTPGTGLFSGVSPDPSGLVQAGDDVYALESGGVGYYHYSATAKVPGKTSPNISEGAERVIWLAVYNGTNMMSLKNGDLEQGEEIEVGDNTSLNVLDYIGSPSEAATIPAYSSTSATDTKTGESSYNSLAADNLTVRASRLTQMVADKAQDKTIGLLPSGYTAIVNTTNALNQDITFTGGGTLNIAVPSSANNGTIGLTGTLSLAANQAAYFTVDRNAAFSFADLTALTIANISAVPLDEKTFIFAYRLAGTDIWLWDGKEVPVGTTYTPEAILNIVNQDRSLKMVRGGTFTWNSGTGQLSFTADAFIQAPGLAENRNTIPFSTQSPITLASDGDVAYVQINRDAGIAANLTVTVAAISSVPVSQDVVVIARRLGTDVLIGTGTILLRDGEALLLDGALNEINNHFDLIKLRAQRPNTTVVDVSDALSQLADGTKLIIPFNQGVVDYGGGTIDFAAGTITGGGAAFTGATGTLGASQEMYFAVALLSGSPNVLGVVPGTPAAIGSASYATFPASSIPIAQVRVFSDAGSVVQAIPQTDIYQSSGTGSGGGSGSTTGRSGQDAIGLGATSVTVVFSSPLLTADYVPVVSMVNTVDASPQFQPLLVSNKTTNGFTVKWNDATDSANYELAYSVPNIQTQVGESPVGLAQTSLTITLPIALSGTTYAPIAQLVDYVDGSPQFQPTVVTAKTTTTFTVQWNAPTDSANYKIAYQASEYQ